MVLNRYMRVNDLFYSYGLGEKNMADNREQVKERPILPWNDSFGDHIRILDNVIDHSICDDCIDMFDDLEYRGLCHTRKDLGSHFGQSWGSDNKTQSTGQRWMR